MDMPKNNDSIYFKDWTTQKLKDHAISLWECIYGANQCYGTKDMLNLEGCLNELENRGYEIQENMTITKKEHDDWHKKNNIPYTVAWLSAIKSDKRRPHSINI